MYVCLAKAAHHWAPFQLFSFHPPFYEAGTVRIKSSSKHVYSQHCNRATTVVIALITRPRPLQNSSFFSHTLIDTQGHGHAVSLVTTLVG